MNQQAWDISIEHLDGGYEGRLVLQDFSATLPAQMVRPSVGDLIWVVDEAAATGQD